MKTVVCSLVSVMVAWGTITAAQSPLPVADMQRMLARGKLVVALIDTDYPPLFVTSQAGQLSGSDISLVRNIARELGVPVVFNRQAHSFAEVIDIVARGDADLGIGTSITLPRAKHVLFSTPYMTLKIALLINRLKLIDEGITSELRDLAALRQTTQKIGMLMGSAYREYAEQMFPKADLQEYRSLQQLIAAVEQGELLAAVRNDLTANLYLHQNPAAVLQLQLFVDEGAKDYVALCIRPDSPHLRFWLNAYMLIKHVNLSSNDLVEKYKQ